MKRQLTAPLLSIFLSIAVVLAVIAGGAGFMYLRDVLVDKAATVSKLTSQAESSRNKQQSIQEAKKILLENDSTVAKAKNMIIDSTTLDAQNIIIQDIYSIAGTAGVQITSIDFPAAQTTTGAATQQSTAAQAALPAGVHQVTANVTVKGPVRYDKLITFIHYIEVNNRKMQLSRVSITNTDQTENGYSMVNSENFTIGVYVR